MSTCALGSAATRGASSHATASTKTALARTGSAVDEKNGAKTTMPLTRNSASVRAARKALHSVIRASSQVAVQVDKQKSCVRGHAAQEPGHAGQKQQGYG